MPEFDVSNVRPTSMSLTISTDHYFDPVEGKWFNLELTHLTDAEIDAWMALGNRRYDDDFNSREWILGLRRRYMMCRGCGEVFEQVDGNRMPPAALEHIDVPKDERCIGGFKRDMTEEEAF